TGDRRLLEELWPAARRAFEFALTTDTDGDGLIENSGVGHGWAEGGRIYGGHCTFYLAACWAAALDAMHSLAAAMGQPRVAASCAERRDRVKSVLNGDFYREDQGWFAYAKNRDGSYANAETIEPAAAALLGLMEPSKLGRFFQEVAGERFTTPWGVRYIARDDPAYHPRGYHYGSVWPLFTGWVAMAEYRCGRPEAGFRHLWSSLQQVCKHSLGAIDEVLDGDSDVPAGVCPHQLWSHALTVMPVLEGMLGLRPDAPHNRLSIAPQLPATWDWVRVRRLRLGQRSLALMVERTPSGLRVEVENAAGPGRPEIVLRPPGGAA
ncbi:MAG: hypothetical protein KGJ86_22250, partial [Chloroflexota bacterium]|nr:hypothetical protein [Chloroflexota bacterium]